MGDEYRLDDLARRAGVASTTVRLYRSKGLLDPPRLEGRTGWYDDRHLERLRLIARLQEQGFSLAGIATLLERWAQGDGLDALVGVEAELGTLLGDAHAVEMEPAELLARFPAGAMTPELMRRAAALGIVTPASDGRLRVSDRRFVESGSALAQLGIPLDVVLDEWEALVTQTDDIARRFIALFEERLAPAGWQDGLDPASARDLTATLGQLRATAGLVLDAALDASLARLGRERLGALLEATEATVTDPD
jgi:DNA-binding transcriptional MerR regulator